MRPIDEESQRTLAVIDQTLAGEAVSPQDAELAELTLILAGQRPQPTPSFAAALDQRVAARFAAPAPSPASEPARRRRRRWLYAPGAVLAVAAAAAGVIVVSSGAPPRQLATDLSVSKGVAHVDVAPATAASAAATSTSAASSASSGSPARPAASSLAPNSTPGRQVISSAQISLSTRPSQVDNVAQQVFTVIANQNGVVESSNVTSTSTASGYAQFQLSVPNANLGATMAALSRLQGAAVVSRTDASQDVTGRVGGAGRRLADARALRTALLRKLAVATTPTAIDSLQAQIRDADASIASDLSTLRSLQHQVASSQISLTVNASMIVGHPSSTNGGPFSLGRAAHDAGRVLVVAAGVALIALAVLVPLGLLAAVGLWVGYAVRRHRREQALDVL
jgi:hypothetical protein